MVRSFTGTPYSVPYSGNDDKATVDNVRKLIVI